MNIFFGVTSTYSQMRLKQVAVMSTLAVLNKCTVNDVHKFLVRDSKIYIHLYKPENFSSLQSNLK